MQSRTGNLITLAAIVSAVLFAQTIATAEWTEPVCLTELHAPQSTDRDCSLTPDELTIMWVVHRPSHTTQKVMIATRASISEPFSNEHEVTELSAMGATAPDLSPDGLRVYFSAPHPDTGKSNIYRMTRPSLDEPFANLEHLEGVTGPGPLEGGNAPSLTPDEKTVYFYGGRGDTLDVQGIFGSYWITDPLGNAVENIEAAIQDKNAAIALIAETLKKETAALEALNQLRDTTETDPVKILQAKTSIFRAINRQLRARIELKRAIAELQKSLKKLQAPDKPQRNNSRNSKAPVGPKPKERTRRTR
jgi:hypothetical protein